MSFQAYLDNIKAKTGKTPDDLKKLAEKKGLLKPGVKATKITDWLKKEFGLGHGHAMAIYAVFASIKGPSHNKEESIDKHFSGGKAHWRKAFDSMLSKLNKFGADIQIAPTDTYLSIVNDGKKFAIVQFTTDRMDIGIKLKGAAPTNRFEPAGKWNAMVTHRVHIDDPKQIDAELMKWLKQAYEQTIK